MGWSLLGTSNTYSSPPVTRVPSWFFAVIRLSPKLNHVGSALKSVAYVSASLPEGLTLPFSMLPSASVPDSPGKPIHTAASIASGSIL